MDTKRTTYANTLVILEQRMVNDLLANDFSYVGVAVPLDNKESRASAGSGVCVCAGAPPTYSLGSLDQSVIHGYLFSRSRRYPGNWPRLRSI